MMSDEARALPKRDGFFARPDVTAPCCEIPGEPPVVPERQRALGPLNQSALTPGDRRAFRR
jgi:hypothetical protein